MCHGARLGDYDVGAWGMTAPVNSTALQRIPPKVLCPKAGGEQEPEREGCEESGC